VIVDVVEPDARGAALCRRLREASPRLPVLMLGAGDTVVERTGGLAAGADDYLAKPFVLIELLTRIRGLLRRNGRGGSEVLRFADLVLDQTTHEVVRGGRRIELTPIEFGLLELFLRHPREVLPRALIFTRVWGLRLRVQLELPQRPPRPSAAEARSGRQASPDPHGPWRRLRPARDMRRKIVRLSLAGG
jgi:two-component system response regulator MprA